MSLHGPKANPPQPKASPWLPEKVPDLNIPYDENFYADIIQKMEKRLEQLQKQSKTDPSLLASIDNFNCQIAIAEIVRRLHSDFQGKINAIANSWWSHIRKLEKAPENASLFQGNFKGQPLNAFVFHFKDFTGKPTLPKKEQMKNIANKLKSLVEQFHYAYEVANKHDELDAVVNSCGGGCFEGQVEGVFTGAVSIDKKHLTQKISHPSENVYFLEKHQAVDAAMNQLKEIWDKHSIDYSQMYAQEMLSYLKEYLGANSNIRMGDDTVSNLFFDVATDEEALAILEAYSYPSLPDKNEKDPNKAWLGKFSDVLSDIEDVTDSLHLRRLRVLEQTKYEGGKESCGYHGIKNAFGMLTAINKGVNPAGTVFDENEFARVYNYFKANVVSKRGYGSQDLFLNEAQEFLDKIEKKGLEEDFGDYATAYSEIKSKQGGIAPISIVPISLDDEEQCHYLPGAATTNNIIDLYKIATNPKQALDHIFLVADSALGAGHWLALSLHVNADGTKQWISMDSDNNRTTRAERVANLLNSMLAKPEAFIKEAFEEKCKDAIAIRAKYIDKNNKKISQENKKVLLTKEVEDEQLNVISDAIRMLGETAIKREDVQSTLDNMALLIDFYAKESKQPAVWTSLKEKLQQIQLAQAIIVSEPSKEDIKPIVEVKLPAKTKMDTFDNMYQHFLEEGRNEATEVLFNRTKAHYESTALKVPMLKMTEGEFAALKSFYENKPRAQPVVVEEEITVTLDMPVRRSVKPIPEKASISIQNRVHRKREQTKKNATVTSDFPEMMTFSKMQEKIPTSEAGEKIPNKDGKVLYKLNNGKIFFKERSTIKVAGVNEGREVAGAWVANYITGGAVPKAHIRKVNTKLGIAQEYVNFKPFTKNSIKELNKDQVTQLLIHLIADKAISNYDVHLDNYGLNEKGEVIGIDKGEALRFFQRNKVGYKTSLGGAGHDSDDINLDQYGKMDINIYKQVFELVKQGELEVDFNDARIAAALKRCTDLSLEDIKQMYSGYAELQFKLPAKREEFYKEMHGRLQNMPQALEKFKDKYKQESKVAIEVPLEQQLDKENLPPVPPPLSGMERKANEVKGPIDKNIIFDLITTNVIEIPKNVDKNQFVNSLTEYLMGTVPLEIFEGEQQKRRAQWKDKRPKQGLAQEALQQELKSVLAKKKGGGEAVEASSDEPDPRMDADALKLAKQNLEKQLVFKKAPQAEQNQIVVSPQEKDVAPEVTKRLVALANKGIIGINRPLEGDKGVVNFLLGKTTELQERKLDERFRRNNERQPGHALAGMSTEDFLKHVDKVKGVESDKRKSAILSSKSIQSKTKETVVKPPELPNKKIR